MRDRSLPSPAVVVGIDGSRSALTAALWAVDEALDRDLPLRLLYAIEPRDAPVSADQAARDLAAAEIAIREAFMAIESLDQALKIEVEIVQDNAKHALINVSHSATLLCLGGLGIGRSTGRHFGSVAAAVSRDSGCPVAIIRRHALAKGQGCVIAEVDDSADRSQILEVAVTEARLRRCPLRVLATWRPRFTDVVDAPNVAAKNRLTRAQLDKQLAWWRRHYPDLDIVAVAAGGSSLNYLAQHADSINLLVVGHRQAYNDSSSVHGQAHHAVRDTNCSVLICGHHSAL